MIYALIGAIISAITLILQKYILSYLKVNYKTFNVLVFIFLFLFTAVLFPKFGWIKPEALSFYYLLFGILMVITATFWNILLSQALQKEHLVEFELIQMLQPLLTIFLGSLIFTSERSMYILPVAFIGSLALIIAHIRRDHIYFDKYAKYLLLAVVLMSIEMIFIKILLNVYSPVALYMVRTFFVAIVSWVVLRPSFKGLDGKRISIMAGTSALAVAQMVLIYTAIELRGLVFTTLILILTPILVYVLSVIFFREKLKTMTVISAVVIVFCIVYATLSGK